MARLSAHFDSSEFDCHDGTRVPGFALGRVRRLCRSYLEPLRAEFGPVRVISGFRTPEHNRSVGGAPHSYHVYAAERPGAAADVSAARGTSRQWYDFLDRRGPGGLGFYDGHVHVDTRNGHARW